MECCTNASVMHRARTWDLGGGRSPASASASSVRRTKLGLRARSSVDSRGACPWDRPRRDAGDGDSPSPPGAPFAPRSFTCRTRSGVQPARAARAVWTGDVGRSEKALPRPVPHAGAADRGRSAPLPLAPGPAPSRGVTSAGTA